MFYKIIFLFLLNFLIINTLIGTVKTGKVHSKPKGSNSRWYVDLGNSFEREDDLNRQIEMVQLLSEPEEEDEPHMIINLVWPTAYGRRFTQLPVYRQLRSDERSAFLPFSRRAMSAHGHRWLLDNWIPAECTRSARVTASPAPPLLPMHQGELNQIHSAYGRYWLGGALAKNTQAAYAEYENIWRSIASVCPTGVTRAKAYFQEGARIVEQLPVTTWLGLNRVHPANHRMYSMEHIIRVLERKTADRDSFQLFCFNYTAFEATLPAQYRNQTIRSGTRGLTSMLYSIRFCAHWIWPQSGEGRAEAVSGAAGGRYRLNFVPCTETVHGERAPYISHCEQSSLGYFHTIVDQWGPGALEGEDEEEEGEGEDGQENVQEDGQGDYE